MYYLTSMFIILTLIRNCVYYQTTVTLRNIVGIHIDQTSEQIGASVLNQIRDITMFVIAIVMTFVIGFFADSTIAKEVDMDSSMHSQMNKFGESYYNDF